MDTSCLLAVAVLCLSVAYYYRYFKWHYGIFRRLGIPGPSPIPVLGTMLPMMREGLTAFDTHQRKYGKVVGTFQGPTPILLIYDTKILQHVLVTEFSNFTNRFNPGVNDYPLSKLLLFVNDDHWRHIRNHITPSFSGRKLRKMNAKILQCIETLHGNLERMAESKEIFEFKALSGAFAVDVIASTAFGLKIDSHNDPNNQFVLMAKQAGDLNFGSIVVIVMFFFPYLMKPLSSLGLVSIFPNNVVNFFTSVVDRALAERQNLENDDVDFLQLMINAHVDDDEYDRQSEAEKTSQGQSEWTRKRGLSHEEVLAQCILFFLAGYDTTASSLAYFVYELACHPDIQDRLIKEIDEVMKDQKQVTYDLIQKMSYLDMCLSESLRLYPIGARPDRVTRNDITIDGVKIPKDMTIGIPIYALHHDPNAWPNPHRFDPERFTPAAKAARNPFHYLPFGIGPRNCVGMRLALMELKMAVVYLLQRLNFVVCEETQIPLQLEKFRLTPVNGIKLRVEKRQKSP